MGNEKTISVNGKSHPYADGMTLSSLLDALWQGHSPVTAAAAVNELVIPREKYGVTPLNPGDEIEIVHFVGGG
ncbi:hypothetical protein FACS1894206_03950 [Deltaproteobacteria bacterium]|nr:hypothetical protein FACS1894206_03950 [Deltaproteobacteria bacterium]